MDFRNKWLRRYLIVSPLVAWGLIGLWGNIMWWTAFPTFGWRPSLATLFVFTGIISVYSATIILLCGKQFDREITWCNFWFAIVLVIHLVTFAVPAGTIIVRMM
jgi:hypothetical protein